MIIEYAGGELEPRDFHVVRLMLVSSEEQGGALKQRARL